MFSNPPATVSIKFWSYQKKKKKKKKFDQKRNCHGLSNNRSFRFCVFYQAKVHILLMPISTF